MPEKVDPEPCEGLRPRILTGLEDPQNHYDAWTQKLKLLMTFSFSDITLRIHGRL